MSPSLLCTCLRPRLALANPAALAGLAARVGGRSLHAPATAPMDKRIPAARGKSLSHTSHSSPQDFAGAAARQRSSAAALTRSCKTSSSSTDSSLPHRAGSIKTTADLLAATKRKFGSYESKLGDWNSLFSKTGGDLRDVGMSVSDRRYLLWILEKFRYDIKIGERSRELMSGG